MSLAILASRGLRGLDAPAVHVEVHVSAGLPAFHIVGLADTAVRESRERVRAAILTSGYTFPAGRITVNLSPADLPKESSRFDLPIAIGVLLASGQIADAQGQALDATHLSDWVLAGELSLTGMLVDMGAALPIARAVAVERVGTAVLLPKRSAAAAAYVPGVRAFGAASLAEVVAHLSGVAPLTQTPTLPPPSTDDAPRLCLSDVRGQAAPCRALMLAAAGAHSLLMVGPPGSGKSMLAQRLPGILPPLSADEWLEAAAIAALCGRTIPTARPFRAPHHGATAAALVGGGARPTPGEVTLAHHGVLFLDELPEFRRDALEALREPIESHHVHLARAVHHVTYPATFQLVAAMNPCPCGYLGHPRRKCVCSADQAARYAARLSGPLLDRIDMRIAVPTPDLRALAVAGEVSSLEARRQVANCRTVQQQRQGKPNARLDAGELTRYCPMDDDARSMWRAATSRWDLSPRAAQRVVRLARTVADLAGSGPLAATHVAEALHYRHREAAANVDSTIA